MTRRAWTDAERQEARDMRAGGRSNRAIAKALRRNENAINRQIGKPAPRPPARTARGLRKQRQKARVSKGQGNELRAAEHGYALPAGSPETWGAISSEPFPHGGIP